MSKNQALFFINTDRIAFNFPTNLIALNSENPFLKNEITEHKFTIVDLPFSGSIDNLYRYKYAIYYNKKYFGYFNFMAYNPQMKSSQFHVDSYALYTMDWTNILYKLFEALGLSKDEIIKYIHPSYSEFCINTNVDLSTSFYTNFFNNKLSIKDGYIDTAVSRIKSLTDIHKMTFYLQNGDSAIKMRVENKSNEIRSKNLLTLNRSHKKNYRDKTYILSAYSDTLDINKDIYRLELIVNYWKLRKDTASKVYVHNNLFEFATLSEYKKLSVYRKNQFQLYNSKFPLHIPFEKFVDQDFLLGFMNKNSVFDYKKIINVKPTFLRFDNVLTPVQTRITREKDLPITDEMIARDREFGSTGYNLFESDSLPVPYVGDDY